MSIDPEYINRNPAFGELVWKPNHELYALMLEVLGDQPKTRAAVMLLIEDFLSVELALLANVASKYISQPHMTTDIHRKATQQLRKLLREISDL